MFVSFFRVIKFAFQNFFRNFWLSFVTLTILILALSSTNVLLILNAIANTAVNEVQNQIDVTVYFKEDISEEQVLNVKNYLIALSDVKNVTYISKEDALVSFRAKHKTDDKILETLDELDGNPLGATLVIQANSVEDYDSIIANLESKQYNNLIEDKDFDDHKVVIDKIKAVTQRVAFAVMALAIAFTIISILISFNAIRIAIYTHREEIRIMSLVGATDKFIIAPYLLEGVILSLLSVVFSIFILYPFLGVLQPYIETFFENGSLNLVRYFSNNFVLIFGAQLLVATLINIFAALVAAKKYLKY